MDTTKPFSSKLIAVGSAGMQMLKQFECAPFASLSRVAIHTSQRALGSAPAECQLLVGASRLHGLGCGGDPEVAAAALAGENSRLQELAKGVDMVFLLAGLGGGTGSGIAPAIAKYAKESGALVIALVSLPFDFEGVRRAEQARSALQNLKGEADAVICLPNEKLFELINGQTRLEDALLQADKFIAQAVAGIFNMLTFKPLIHLDFAYLYSVLRGRHVESSFACAEAAGPERVSSLLQSLLSNPLLDEGVLLREADSVLVSVLGGDDLALLEMKELMAPLNQQIQTGNVVMGAAIDPSLNGRIAMTVIASRNPTPAENREASSKPAATGAPEFDTSFFHAVETPRPAPRFVAPPPQLTPDKTIELYQQTAGRRGKRKTTPKMRQGQLPLEIISKGRFEKSEPTIHHGEDLDVPTYIRRCITLN